MVGTEIRGYQTIYRLSFMELPEFNNKKTNNNNGNDKIINLCFFGSGTEL